MRFEGQNGSRVDVELVGTGAVIVSVTEHVTEQAGGQDAPVAFAILDVNHAEALAAGILAGCKELHARAVSP